MRSLEYIIFEKKIKVKTKNKEKPYGIKTSFMNKAKKNNTIIRSSITTVRHINTSHNVIIYTMYVNNNYYCM